MNNDIFITNQQYVGFRRTAYIFPTLLHLQKIKDWEQAASKIRQRENWYIFVAIDTIM